MKILRKILRLTSQKKLWGDPQKSRDFFLEKIVVYGKVNPDKSQDTKDLEIRAKSQNLGRVYDGP